MAKSKSSGSASRILARKRPWPNGSGIIWHPRPECFWTETRRTALRPSDSFSTRKRCGCLAGKHSEIECRFVAGLAKEALNVAARNRLFRRHTDVFLRPRGRLDAPGDKYCDLLGVGSNPDWAG